MRKNGLIILLLLLFTGRGWAQSDSLLSYQHSQRPPTAAELLQWHETFTYKVHYSFFTLGEVKVKIVSDTLYNGKKSWHLQSVITSNSHLPFVGKEENHYNSIFRIVANRFVVQQFWTDDVDENEYKKSQYIFDRKHGKVYAHEVKDDKTVEDTLSLEEPASSGHALFYMNRLFAGTDTTLKVPIYISGEKKYMTLQNTTKTEKRGYDAFDNDVKTYYTQGTTDIDGPFGFSGAFKCWYLADDLRVPLEARVKVWLGHVKIKLVNYKKERRK